MNDEEEENASNNGDAADEASLSSSSSSDSDSDFNLLDRVTNDLRQYGETIRNSLIGDPHDGHEGDDDDGNETDDDDDFNDDDDDDDDIHRELRRAAYQGNLEACRRIFSNMSESDKERYRDRYTLDRYKNGPLHNAAKRRHIEILRFLVQECHFAVNKLDSWAIPPLGCTLDLETTRFLLDNGADPNFSPRWRQHPLFNATITGSTNVMRLLLDHGAVAIHPERPPAVVMTILLGEAEGLSILLDYYGGANLLSRATLGWFYGPLLVYMLLSGDRNHETRVSIFRVLVNHAQSSSSRENSRSTMRLLHATLNSLIDMQQDEISSSRCFEILLEAGLVPKIQTVHRAIRNGHDSFCQLLVQSGVVDPFQVPQGTSSGSARTSLFHTAAKQKNTEVLRVFLDHWDERFTSNGGRNNDGDYPIHVLCCFPNVSFEAIKLVLDRQGPTSSTVDGEQGLLPLHFAALWGTNLNVLYSLVRHHPDALNARRRHHGQLAATRSTSEATVVGDTKKNSQQRAHVSNPSKKKKAKTER